MGRTSFDNYGLRAAQLDDPTVIAGRYAFQREAESRIVLDIVSKLQISCKDRCLDIGCGVGNILIPLSFLVRSITGIDHPSCIRRLRERIGGLSNVKLIPGNFLDISVKGHFDKIIVYSVIQYLSEESEIYLFIKKTLSLLKPGGRLLLGDIPNQSLKDRFTSSKAGMAFSRKWAEKVRDYGEAGDSRLKDTVRDSRVVTCNDDIILSIVSWARKAGYNAFLLPQSPELPFGYTREDILIEKFA